MPQDPNRGIPGYGRIIFPDRIKRAMYQAQRGRCNYCGRTHRIGYLEIDHKQPVSRGGDNGMENLHLLCVPCNMRKGIQNDEEFRRRYRRIMAPRGSIPNPSIPQESFSDETQQTRASREVRSIYHKRFSAYRASRRDGCGVFVAMEALIVIAIAFKLLAG